MRTGTIAALVLVAAAALAGAQGFSADYVQGVLSIEQSGSWYEVSIGDAIPADGTLKLGAGSYAELSNGAVTVKLSSPGTYRMPDLVKANETISSAHLGNLLSRRIEVLTRGDSGQSPNSVGGVRAAEAQSGPQTVWAGGESAEELIAQGIALLKNGSYDEAFYRFKDAYDNADSSVAPEARFYMGYAASLKNDTFKAITFLTSYKPDPASSYYSNQVLILAQLYVQTFAYKDALGLLDPYIAAGSAADQDLQTAYLLQGLAYRGLSDAQHAKTALLKARDLIPGSPVADAAARVLAGM
ncbi:tetratricopeptide repeat protein [Salinispira pacifica]